MNQEHKINPNALKGWLLTRINISEENKVICPSIAESIDGQISGWKILLEKLETNEFQEDEQVHLKWYKQYKGE